MRPFLLQQATTGLNSQCVAYGVTLALLPRFVDLDKIHMQVNLHGAMLLTFTAIEASSPIALIWLFLLLKETKGMDSNTH